MSWFLLAGCDDSFVTSRRNAELPADKLEAVRRVAQESEIAKQVPVRLFPQKLLQFKNLDFAGRCIQARDVRAMIMIS